MQLRNGVPSPYGTAIRLMPDNAEAYNNRGSTQSALNQHEAAIADYDRAIHLTPDLAEAIQQSGKREGQGGATRRRHC